MNILDTFGRCRTILKLRANIRKLNKAIAGAERQYPEHIAAARRLEDRNLERFIEQTQEITQQMKDARNIQQSTVRRLCGR